MKTKNEKIFTVRTIINGDLVKLKYEENRDCIYKEWKNGYVYYPKGIKYYEKYINKEVVK